ncbi:MAG: CAP domain-containing protein [Candidatus Dojkabacteria bacterium]|nr:CAP domain-containing protein [Candidatus Dojkabacteria bacterium]
MLKNFFIPRKENKYKPYLLRRITVLLYSVILVFVNTFGGFLGISQVSASTITPTNIINLTNKQRASMGLNTLKVDSRLSSAALAKANNMFEEQYWDHYGPNGETPWQFIRGAGYNYVYAGENLAKGFSTAEGVHEAWMASPTHKANIVSGNYKDIGVAVVEGVLLGKRTTLVVQMFGNLTQDVAGVTKITSPKPSTSSGTVTVGNETGEIKSIMITSPKGSAVITDPSTSVTGSVKNITGEYKVSVYEGEDLHGEAQSSESTWEVSGEKDWEEGDHEIKAKVESEKIESEAVKFTVDSTPPTIVEESITIQEDEQNFTLSLEISSDWKDIKVVSGEETFSVTNENQEEIVITIPKEKLSAGVVLMASDVNGNLAEIDISEYFLDEDERVKPIISFLSTDLGDKISIVLVSFIFILICIEIFVYWKKGMLKEVAGDLFTVGIWWLIISVAVFSGFTGIIT